MKVKDPVRILLTVAIIWLAVGLTTTRCMSATSAADLCDLPAETRVLLAQYRAWANAHPFSVGGDAWKDFLLIDAKFPILDGRVAPVCQFLRDGKVTPDVRAAIGRTIQRAHDWRRGAASSAYLRVSSKTTVTLLREACWICSGAGAEDLKLTISYALSYPHKMPVNVYRAAANRWADWRNFEVMATQWCEPEVGQWDRYITNRYAQQIRDELDLLYEAGPWVRKQVEGTP